MLNLFFKAGKEFFYLLVNQFRTEIKATENGIESFGVEGKPAIVTIRCQILQSKEQQLLEKHFDHLVKSENVGLNIPPPG